MQKLAVVHFLKINTKEIDAFREKYDPGYKLIPPHITMVSPISDLPEIELIDHVSSIVKLHEKLYSGILDSYIPTDFPFVPHITLGSFGVEETLSYREAEKANFDITCEFDEISIIKGDGVSPAIILRTIQLSQGD